MRFRVFVVDDDKYYSRLLSRQLERNGAFEVQTLRSGEDLLERLDKDPHLILLDVMMSCMGGIETLRRIVERKPHIHVIIVSAQDAVEVAVEAMKMSAYDYITTGQDDLIKLDTVVKQVNEKLAMSRELENLRRSLSKSNGMD